MLTFYASDSRRIVKKFSFWMYSYRRTIKKIDF